ncbi:tRNA (adenosine(37)-N6)-threonylcarbamoyltransferase complex dimerization subunit type 1 TsaB [Glaciihabitans arcticus]|uniref:tRNA (Adenosine(37)-N6)-threonylcarbamoyltransferase complex dimerization subunit type 1 TsaB n=1 Tax=Glaciihabitans arcticus TaxID=2668039 RepID=A0A4V2JF25_9MICO|nr:tRNA (adenosine(37)-N6)-threonylcarbamoyltransferase complex dimerization subunit type 1 TsaB [Glaciihabitans arcticus]TBN57789.1 tRNA (adenosine(37)-N6)-threonylcarbamoyltransferase complex dimerization subunit type 1 TsaB [Glaciihabitans arcticus]
MLLAIDTSAGTSVAIVDRDAGVLAEHSSDDTRRHAEVIDGLIIACLEQSGIAVTALSGVAVGMGPGPFTGLRVGIAAARAFAFGAGKPVVPVVSHDAIAFGITEPTLVVTDARRREVYWSAYSGSDEQGLPIRTQGPELARPDDLATAVDGFAGYRRLDAAVVSGASIGLLAEGLYLHGRPFAGNEAMYLRSPDVTMSAGPKRVTA